MSDILKFHSKPESNQSLWQMLRIEAHNIYRNEILLRPLVNSVVLDKENLEQALSYRLASRLDSNDLNMSTLYDLFVSVYQENPELRGIIEADLQAVFSRDPACHTPLQAFLFFKGFHALQVHRIAHVLYKAGRHNIAYLLQSQSSNHFAVDIHPAARIGRGIMLDHATGLVVGETATIGDNASILHGVTLGGTGKKDGDRHPKIGDNVLIGANASILGNIKIGNCSRVASGSVVLSDVPDSKTVAGVPARVVGDAGCDQPSESMNQQL
jgi:serine O-acetyltransferase